MIAPRLKTRRALFLVENLDLEAATGYPGAKWEHFQLNHLNDDGLFRIENKARQISWSWTIAAEAVASAAVDTESSIFVSLNLLEAMNKIAYARTIIDCLPPRLRPTIIRDSLTHLHFDNGTEIISAPSKPPRGKSRLNLNFDEFAHAPKDRELYVGSLPIISKGGRLRIGSSPLGSSGMFWEIDTQSIQPYPGYTRARTPWWHVYAFCHDPPTAIRVAPTLTSAERVERFGSVRIAAIFHNMPLEDFQQEYEASYVDESTAWITWGEIKALQLSSPISYAATGRAGNLTRIYEAIEACRHAVAAGIIESFFGAGMDIGRTRNTTEIFLCGIGADRRYPLRLQLTLDNVEYDDQHAVAALVATTFKLTKFYIDRNGLGSQLAENLSKAFPFMIEGVNFTNESKRAWATQTKMLAQQGRIPIPADRDLAYQIHSIKKMISPSKKLVFDTARNEKHHADKFWAWALAQDAAMHDQKYDNPPPASSSSVYATGL